MFLESVMLHFLSRFLEFWMFDIIYPNTLQNAGKFNLRSYEGFIELKSKITWQVRTERESAAGNFAFLCDVFHVQGESEVFIHYDS